MHVLLPKLPKLQLSKHRPLPPISTSSPAGGAMLAMDLGFMGPNYPIATACATGNYCILRWGAA